MFITNQEIDSIIQLGEYYKNDVLPEDYTEYVRDYDVNWEILIKKLKERRLKILIIDIILDQNVTVPFWMVDSVINYKVEDNFNTTEQQRIRIAQARCMANKIGQDPKTGLESRYLNLLVKIYAPDYDYVLSEVSNTEDKLVMLSIYDLLDNEGQLALQAALVTLYNFQIPQ